MENLIGKDIFYLCVCKKISDEQLNWISYYRYKYYLQQVVMEIVSNINACFTKKCYNLYFSNARYKQKNLFRYIHLGINLD